MAYQSSLNAEDDFHKGQISALEILEDWFQDSRNRGRIFWKSEQVIQVIRSIRLSLEEIFK